MTKMWTIKPTNRASLEANEELMLDGDDDDEYDDEIDGDSDNDHNFDDSSDENSDDDDTMEMGFGTAVGGSMSYDTEIHEIPNAYNSDENSDDDDTMELGFERTVGASISYDTEIHEVPSAYNSDTNSGDNSDDDDNSDTNSDDNSDDDDAMEIGFGTAVGASMSYDTETVESPVPSIGKRDASSPIRRPNNLDQPPVPKEFYVDDEITVSSQHQDTVDDESTISIHHQDTFEIDDHRIGSPSEQYDEAADNSTTKTADITNIDHDRQTFADSEGSVGGYGKDEENPGPARHTTTANDNFEIEMILESEYGSGSAGAVDTGSSDSNTKIDPKQSVFSRGIKSWLPGAKTQTSKNKKHSSGTTKKKLKLFGGRKSAMENDNSPASSLFAPEKADIPTIEHDRLTVADSASSAGSYGEDEETQGPVGDPVNTEDEFEIEMILERECGNGSNSDSNTTTTTTSSNSNNNNNNNNKLKQGNCFLGTEQQSLGAKKQTKKKQSFSSKCFYGGLIVLMSILIIFFSVKLYKMNQELEQIQIQQQQQQQQQQQLIFGDSSPSSVTTESLSYVESNLRSIELDGLKDRDEN